MNKIHIYPYTVIILSFVTLTIFGFSWFGIPCGVFCLCGGIIPIFLPFLFKINTSDFLLEQIIILLLSSVACVVSWILFFIFIEESIISVVVFLCLIISAFFWGIRTKNIKFWIYIQISNPIVYYYLFFWLIVHRIRCEI